MIYSQFIYILHNETRFSLHFRLIFVREIIHFSFLPSSRVPFYTPAGFPELPFSFMCHPLSTLFSRLVRAHRFLVGSLQSDFSSFRGQFFGVIKKDSPPTGSKDFFLHELAKIRCSNSWTSGQASSGPVVATLFDRPSLCSFVPWYDTKDRV